jgi:hypothetical protein
MLTLHLPATTLKELNQQCKQKSPKSCYDLAILYDQKDKTTQAAKLYKRSCGLNYALGCYKLGELYLVGSGVKQSDASFISYMQKACRLGYQKSCSFSQKAKPAIKVGKKRATVSSKKSQRITIKGEHHGTIKVHARLIDRKERIVQIDASMVNHFMQASGWLSFSFPDIQTDQSISLKSNGFDHIKSYPKGYSIYSTAQKKAIQSSYLLIEADAKQWKKKKQKTAYIKIKVPENIDHLTLYIRGVLKHGEKESAIPIKGSIGQQGFSNYKLVIPVGFGKKVGYAQNGVVGTKMIPNSTPTPIQPQSILNRRDKLVLLDQLLDLSYYHRERKAFEKQLKETLFGNAKYLTWIKSYHCSPRKGTSKSRCTLKIAGKAIKKNRTINWEFHVAFTAKKDKEGLRITEMHSLDLLE